MKKNILIGICGGIAAYKVVSLVSYLKQNGFSVRVVLTNNGAKFITPLTLQAISGNPVFTSLWDNVYDEQIDHIALSDWADLIVIAPATFNFISKISNGFADDLLSTIVSATQSPIMFVPGMNNQMWENIINQDNLIKLKRLGYFFVMPEKGYLACGKFGVGRFAREEKIVDKIYSILRVKNEEKILKNKRVLITVGRTEENIDPIRYLSNKSSGKMGTELVKAARDLGANVTVISGHIPFQDVNDIDVIYVNNAQEMFEQAKKFYESNDILIASAAVSDFRIAMYSQEKIKKSKKEEKSKFRISS